MFQNLHRDAARYREVGGWFLSLGFWVGAIYRLGAYSRQVPAIVGIPLRILHFFLKQPFRILLHVELPTRARIGPGLFLMHPFNIIVGSGTVAGEECTIFHEVTIGNGPVHGEPTLGNRVVVFAGARVVGGITVGDRTEIGANCVVTRSVGPGMVVVLPLARVLPQALVRRSLGTPAARREAPEREEPVEEMS